MTRLRWERNEQDRRASLYGSKPLERELLEGKKRKPKKPKRGKKTNQILQPDHNTRVDNKVDDPALRLRKRRKELQGELKLTEKDIRRTEAVLDQKKAEVVKLNKRIERLEHALARPPHAQDKANL